MTTQEFHARQALRKEQMNRLDQAISDCRHRKCNPSPATDWTRIWFYSFATGVMVCLIVLFLSTLAH